MSFAMKATGVSTSTAATDSAPMWLRLSAASSADEKSAHEKSSSAMATSTATAAQMDNTSAAYCADEKYSKEKEGYSKDYLSRHEFRVKLAGKLVDIFDAHGGWHDEISHSLRGWSIKVISLVDQIPDDATYIRKMAAKVKALDKILINFINPASAIQVPYIDSNELLWEQADLMSYLKRNNSSIEAFGAEHHKFAQAIIDWVKVLPETQRESSNKEAVGGFALVHSTNGSAGVVACAKETLISNDLIVERARAEMAIRKCNQVMIAMRESEQLSLQRQHKMEEKYGNYLKAVDKDLAAGKQSLAVVTQMHEEATAIVNQRVKEMGNVFRNTVFTLNYRIDRLTTNLKSCNSQLNGALSTVQEQKSQIAQLAALSQRLSEQVKELEKFRRKHIHIPKF